MLTKKQEDFTQNLFKGLTQRESWIQAGYSNNYALEMVDIHACALANKDKIKTRLQEFNALIISDSIATVTQRKEILTKIANDNHKDPLTARERVQAIAELNKMEGDYAPEKHLVIQDTVIRFIIGKGYIDSQ